jgi:hypothetical protein
LAVRKPHRFLIRITVAILSRLLPHEERTLGTIERLDNRLHGLRGACAKSVVHDV